MPQKLLKIGHRGAAGYEPENTLLSFKKALDLGVDAVEFDVYCCKSGEPVVIHDDKVDRTTDGKGYIWDKTLKELRQLNADKGEKIPLLSEVLDLVDRKVIVDIELKGENTAKPVSDLINFYISKKGWSEDLFLVSSFNRIELSKFKKINSKIKIGAILKGIPADYLKFSQDLGVDFIAPFVESIDKKFVEKAHEKNLKVFVWAPDSKEDIKRVKEMGVDGIFSNFPDKI